MAPPYLSNLGFVGYAKEATLGTPLAAATYVPVLDVGIAKDPGLFDGLYVRQSRDVTLKLPGEQKLTGPVNFALFSLMGMQLVVGAIGSETATTGSTPTNSTTLAALSAAGATTISTTATFSVNDIIQVDSNGSGKAECRKVTIVSGAGPYTITVDTPLTFGHANGATVAKVVAPFTHTIAEANVLPSFTIEKGLAGLTSLQYAGAVADKLGIKGTTKAEVQSTVSFVAQKDAQIASTTPSYTTEPPIILAGVAVTLFSASDTYVESFDLSLDNGVKPHYTYSGNRYPTLLPATTRKISLKVTEALQSMAYYNDLASATASGTPPTGNAVLTFTGGTGDVITITIPQLSMAKYSDPMTVGELILADFTLEAWLGSQANTLSMTVVNSAYAPF